MKKVLIFLAVVLFFSFSCFSQDIKEPDLAGPFSWYSNNPSKLRKQITGYFDKVPKQDIDGEIIGMISPHAGVKFSGPVAAYGFKALDREKIDTVVLIGFSHAAGYEKIAVFDYEGYRTPLGVLYTDLELTKKILGADPEFISRRESFKEENSIELILPLIQVALKNPKVVILAIGNQNFENSKLIAKTLAELLKDKKDYIIIASTDMCHFLPLDKAEKIDSRTIQLIEKMRPEDLFIESAGLNRMCGTGAVVAAMIAVKKLGAHKFIPLKSDTSASTGGNRDDVVGYLSGVFVKEANGDKTTSLADPLTYEQKEKLLQIARDTIALYLEEGRLFKPKVDDPKLKEYRGLFVTLRTDGDLRGCMGDLTGDKPLYLGVVERALSALRDDSRFTFNRLTEPDLDDIHIEISVLSPLKKVDSPDEIIPGVHGVLVKQGFRGGVYLPQVATEMGWDKEEFLDSLCAHKAGLPRDCWKTGKCSMQIFTAEVFEE